MKASPSVLFSQSWEWKLLPLYYYLSPLYSWSEKLLPLYYSKEWKASHLLFSLLTFVQLEWKLLPQSCIKLLSSHLCTVGVKAKSLLFLFSPVVQLEWKLLPLYYSLFSPLYSWSKSFSHSIILSSHLCTVGVKASPSVIQRQKLFTLNSTPLRRENNTEWEASLLCTKVIGENNTHLCTVGVRKLLPLYYSLSHLCTVGVK